MKADLVEVLACPACKGPLSSTDADAGRIVNGILRCTTCSTAAPVAHGFPLFEHTRLDDGRTDAAWVESQAGKWFQERSAYEDFLRKKAERKTYDAYAMFQPFNESLRALLAMIEPIRAQLKPGDVILDSWSRSGWPGAWVASLFPEQHVVSLWEGDGNVLGYAGFDYWLGEGQRRDNWDIIFTHASDPLPFRTGAFALLHGYESLHRYRPGMFVSEAHRVTADDGVIVFTHIHLTNSEPDPWFERGCIQRHGTLYRELFDRLHAGQDRKALVFGERTLFEAGESFTFTDAARTEDYNGAIVIGPAGWEGQSFRTEHAQPITRDSFLIVNPIFDLDLGGAQASWSYGSREGQVGHLLERHPCYEDRIRSLKSTTMHGYQPELVYFAAQSWTFGQIADRLGVDEAELLAQAKALAEQEILWPATVSPAMARLQHYYGTIEVTDPEEGSFAKLWASLPELYEDRPIIETEDGTEFTWDVVEQLGTAAVGWLLETTKVGDRVLLHCPNCPEAYIIIWSCWLTGRTIVPVEPDLPPEAVDELIGRTRPALAFSMQPLSVPSYQFDSLVDEDDPSELPTFSEGIEPYLEAPEPQLPKVDGAGDAAILFTSGSTGRPKGVRLSHAALTSSGAALARHFQWVPGDRLYSGGASYSMSGLRNPALGALHAGATIVLPEAQGPINPLRAYELVRLLSISIVTTVPAQLNAWIAMRERLKDQPRPAALRSIAYTGHGISDAVREEVSQWLEVPVTGYYGLTETCGLCLGDEVGQRAQGNIGGPVAALAQVVDRDGVVVPDGERGELRICSPRIMSGYLEADTVSTVRLEHGWLYTGDAAIRQPDGSVELVGRFDDQIKDRFGDTVFPSEVEAVAAELSGVDDVACLAVTDAADMASLVLFIVAHEGADRSELETQVLQSVDARLGARKRPSRIVFCESLPRKTSGKVNRQALLSQAGIK